MAGPAEDVLPEWQQPGWELSSDRPNLPTAHYTRAALDVLDDARALLAVAVAADRATGDGWPEIVRALGVSANTAARRDRPGASGS